MNEGTTGTVSPDAVAFAYSVGVCASQQPSPPWFHFHTLDQLLFESQLQETHVVVVVDSWL